MGEMGRGLAGGERGEGVARGDGLRVWHGEMA